MLKRVDFDAIVGHQSLTHIIKSIKGKDMLLSDFLWRQSTDNSKPHEIIPISFNMYQVLHEKYYNTKKYFIQTQSQTRSSGIKLPEDHGVGKNLGPNIKPEN